MNYDLAFFFTAEGRISRKDYWIGTVLITLLNFILIMLMVGAFPLDITISVIILMYAIVTLPYYFLVIKRLHDRGYSAKWLWLLLVPIVGVIWLLVQTGFLRGTAGQNKYGNSLLLDTQ
jgi:uncharacterized membrane protein YhaH (DUF805 family)